MVYQREESQIVSVERHSSLKDESIVEHGSLVYNITPLHNVSQEFSTPKISINLKCMYQFTLIHHWSDYFFWFSQLSVELSSSRELVKWYRCRQSMCSWCIASIVLFKGRR